jgi:hypothetical protein
MEEAIQRLEGSSTGTLRLQRMARRYMEARARDRHARQPHSFEAYLRLVDARELSWENRAHFFGVAARLMRRVLVDMARNRNYQKRGGALQVT